MTFRESRRIAVVFRVLMTTGLSWAAAALLSGQLPSTARGQAGVPELEDMRLATGGIEKIRGQHLVLYTDVREDESVRQFPDVFDAAVPQWCEYFGIDPADAQDWQMTGFLMREPQRFRQAGLIDDSLPRFATGFQRDEQIWILPQQGTYYTRHLLLHEGTHGFMQRFLGGYGAPWYSEGMAEMLAVHRFDGDALTLNYALRDRREAPFWGRVKIIQDAVAAGTPKSLDEVLEIDARSFYSAARPYAWSWAACYFLSQHPASRDAFVELRQHAALPSAAFNRQLRTRLADHWRQLNVDWQVMIAEFDFRYDVAAASVRDIGAKQFSRGEECLAHIDSAVGWQRTPLSVAAGETIVLRTQGDSFNIGVVKVTESTDSSASAEPSRRPPIRCPAHGITMDYYRGQPLGRLTVALDASDSAGRSFLLQPQPAGNESGAVRIRFESDGQLCFRVNEFSGDLADNEGSITVEIEKITPKSEKP